MPGVVDFPLVDFLPEFFLPAVLLLPDVLVFPDVCLSVVDFFIERAPATVLPVLVDEADPAELVAVTVQVSLFPASPGATR